MKAVCWYGKEDMRVETVPDPRILNPRDAIVRVTATTICGSDLHIYDGLIPSMEPGDIVGHEMVGEVVEVGPEVKKLQPGNRVVVDSIIACGRCWHCRREEYSLCDNSNPNAGLLEKLYTFAPAGIFGYSHLFGGYAGGQAQYVRVPFAEVGAFPIPEGMSDEQALACSDVFPTGYMAADLCNLQRGDTVAVWGCGPIGQLAIKSCQLLGAERVIAIDNVPERLAMAHRHGGAIPLNQDAIDVPDALRELTGGRGPDACIDAVGMEAHGTHLVSDLYDRAKQSLRLETDRGDVIRQMIECCRKGGTLSIVGVYAMFVDKFPLGPAFNKGLHMHLGQQHGQRYVPRLFEHWRKGEVDPAFIFTDRFSLDQAPQAYERFKRKRNGCVKVLLSPDGQTAT